MMFIYVTANQKIALVLLLLNITQLFHMVESISLCYLIIRRGGE